MLFTSGEFLFVYLPLTLLLFFLIARYVGNAAAAAWLVLASFVFYAYWLPLYTGLLATSVVFNYALGNRILACPADRRRLRRGLLCFAVGVDLLLLGYFKYANFFLGTVAELSGRPLGALNVILPIGISFFTFTQIAYLADVHAGKVRERNPLHYALFVSYFPHLIAGPVLHHAEMLPQFALPRFLRDYLYFPLGGNRRGSARRYVNLMITMLLGGLWHGASWTFVVWGGLHGIYLALNHAWRFLRDRVAGLAAAGASGALRLIGRSLAMTLTLFAVVIAWVFFRAHSGQEAWHILGTMFAARASGPAPEPGIALPTVLSLAAGFALATMARNSQQIIDGSLAAAVRRIAAGGWRVLALGAVVGAELTAIAMLALISASRSTTEFIYFNF